MLPHRVKVVSVVIPRTISMTSVALKENAAPPCCAAAFDSLGGNGANAMPTTVSTARTPKPM